MAQQSPTSSYSPDMDEASHEATYIGFTHFAAIGAAVALCWVASLAVGGLKQAWMTAILGVVLSSVAGTIGAMSSLTWRPPVGVLVFLLLLLLVY